MNRQSGSDRHRTVRNAGRTRLVISLCALITWIAGAFAPAAADPQLIERFREMMEVNDYFTAVDSLQAWVAEDRVSLLPQDRYMLGSCHLRLAHLYETLYSLTGFLGCTYYRCLEREICSDPSGRSKEACDIVKMYARLYSKICRETPEGDDVFARGAGAVAGQPCAGLLVEMHGLNTLRGAAHVERQICTSVDVLSRTDGGGCGLVDTLAGLCSQCAVGDDPTAPPIRTLRLDLIASGIFHRIGYGESAGAHQLELALPYGLLVLRSFHVRMAQESFRTVLGSQGLPDDLEYASQYQLLKCIALGGDRGDIDEFRSAATNGLAGTLIRVLEVDGADRQGIDDLAGTMETARDASLFSDALLAATRAGAIGPHMAVLADSCARRLIESGVTDLGAYARLACVYVNTGQFERARQMFDRCNIVDPVSATENFPPAYLLAYANSLCRDVPVQIRYVARLLFEIQRRYPSAGIARQLLLGLSVQKGLDGM